MILDSQRFARVAHAVAVRHRILTFVASLERDSQLPLISALLRIRLDAAVSAFLDAPSAAHLARLTAIEDELQRLAPRLVQIRR